MSDSESTKTDRFELAYGTAGLDLSQSTMDS